MDTLAEIEAAAEALPPEQKEELFRFLAERLRPSNTQLLKARLVRQGDDAPEGAAGRAAHDAGECEANAGKLSGSWLLDVVTQCS
ncbi:MAG: hypothetical protein LC776_14605 [Acidobacteria bacterium]|nr:hypothetical protein [Acidobacteriota bacterium]